MEYDVESAAYVRRELMKEAMAREERDRDFWMVMFGGEPKHSNGEEDWVNSPVLTEEEFIARSPLGQR